MLICSVELLLASPRMEGKTERERKNAAEKEKSHGVLQKAISRVALANLSSRKKRLYGYMFAELELSWRKSHFKKYS